MGNWEIVQALAFEPRKAFAELAERPKSWFPQLLLIVATTGVVLWYLSFVDMEWMVYEQMRNSPFAASLTDEQIARQAAQAASRRGVQMGISGIGYMVAIPLMTAVSALWYLLAGKVTAFDRSFRHWFSFVSWTSLPTALAVIPIAFVLLTASSNQISQQDLQPLSLNALFFHRGPKDPGFSLLSGINLLNLATLWLTAVGARVWSGKSWLYSWIFAALPWVLVCGVWGWFSFR